MHELIKIQHDNDRITVLARDLHDFLEVGTQFKDWFPRMCEYGFQENEDFNPLKIEQVRLEGNREVKRELQDYQLTIEMAKEIAMIQRNEKGKQARQYFIQLENDWNSPQKVMARALQMSQRELQTLRIENEEMKPKALFADAVSTSHDSILIGQLAKLIKQNGCDIGQNRLFTWMRENEYLCTKGDNYNMPTQKAMERGLFEIKEQTVNNPDGSVRTTRTTKVTGKGQIYFVNKFCIHKG
ncbi:phage antirepressor KilAC domain-containing protein [[Clostridium] innocuum]|nr:phage antirepressor KilAC domain-containing protein [[Clostridium] innocuum]MCR0447365.1 phage antirepressor KilAC domain-containing protein [[Clostridium] innocuum]